MSRSYIDYVSSVLGINEISISKPLFLFEKSSSLQSVLEPGPASELLEKILAAMGTRRNEIEIQEYDIAELKMRSMSEDIVFTSKDSEGEWTELSCKIVTYHPSVLVNFPALKKTAWESLQKARR